MSKKAVYTRCSSSKSPGANHEPTQDFFFTFSSYLFILIYRLYCIWHPKKNKLFIAYIFKLNFF